MSAARPPWSFLARIELRRAPRCAILLTAPRALAAADRQGASTTVATGRRRADGAAAACLLGLPAP